MRGLALWLRWSWRDLRARWLQVAAIALIIAIGSGTYSGLTSVSAWRQASYDASYDALDMYDLRVALTTGSFADADRLLAAAAAIPHAADIAAAEPRLEVPIQVDASTADELVLVPGRLVGVDVRDGGPHVSGIATVEGRGLRPDDAAGDTVVVDEHLVQRHDLAPTGTLRLSGGRELRYVGTGLSPENFFPVDDRGSVFADFAVVYAPLSTVQRVGGHPGQANRLVLRVRPGADRDAVEREIEDALAAELGDVGLTVTRQEDDQVLRLLYDDIEGDQRFYDIFAVLILAGATFAAFNLTVRIVEAQRREIGIGMALGVPPRTIAVRPMLVGAQVALLGVAFGVGVGLLIDELMADLLSGFFPLPVWEFAFRPGIFLRGAALGLALPLAATAVPVRRAVRVTPVEAVSTTHRTASGGLAPLLSRLPLPGSSVTQMPFRNVLREPRRTLLTALGIAAAITTLIGVIGMVDSFVATIAAGDDEIVGDTPDRLTVDLDGFALVDAPEVTAITDDPMLRAAETGLTLGGTLEPGDDGIDVALYTVDLQSDLWVPTAVEGDLDHDGPGLVLSEKAAADLGVGVGDDVTLRHPRREGVGYRWVESELAVLALHPNPYRFIVYLDDEWASLFDLEGVVNTVRVAPADGVTVPDVQRDLFGQEGVASVVPVTDLARSVRDQIDEVFGIFRVIEGAVLLMALLIAFNATSINLDERARENATLFAFGLPVSRVVLVAVTESLVIGVLGTVTGVIAGRLLLAWLMAAIVPGTLPDIGVVTYLSASTVATALVLGVLAVTIAPLLTVRRLRRMDIPSTLRVVE
ncbi:MAG: ABC transporter permease [Acidimicrobiales bacterium]|nr:ABC transporter permease [Acidimicrobiales bacterium]MCB9371194.1 ABC transporter permease [Microthrixaceae bacterium]